MRRPVVRRLTAVLAATVTGIAAAMAGVRPVAAAAPWLTVSDGYASFTVPAGAVQAAMGNVTDFVYPMVTATMATLDELGVRYESAGVTAGPHGWDTWQRNLIDYAPRLFHDSS
jgi:hypothetical protein